MVFETIVVFCAGSVVFELEQVRSVKSCRPLYANTGLLTEKLLLALTNHGLLLYYILVGTHVFIKTTVDRHSVSQLKAAECMCSVSYLHCMDTQNTDGTILHS